MASPAVIMRSRSPSPAGHKKVTIKSASRRPKAATQHPKTLYMICQAIFKLKDRKGASTQAIKKHIMETHKDIPVNRLNVMLKRAFSIGLKSGALVRPKGSSATGATGRFRVGSVSAAKDAGKPKKALKKKPKMKKAKKPTKAKAKKGKTAKKVKKSIKKTSKKPKVKKAKTTAKPKTKKITKTKK